MREGQRVSGAYVRTHSSATSCILSRIYISRRLNKESTLKSGITSHPISRLSASARFQSAPCMPEMVQNAKKPNTQRKISDQSSHSIIPTVLFRFFPNSTTLGRSGCFTSTVLRTCRLAFDTLTCLATLTCTICLSKSSGDLTRR